MGEQMTQYFKENKLAVTVLLSLVGGWILYVLFGHEQLIRAMHEGRLPQILSRLLFGDVPLLLEYRLERTKEIFFGLNCVGIFSIIVLFSIWTGKNISKKWFVFILLALSICQISTFINFKDINGLFRIDDHPKYYSFTVENAKLFLKYGTPFGFNHYFQGGIPTFYLRSCFLEFIPFSFFLNDQMAYQVMLIFFIALIPVTLFFLILELTKNEDIAKTVSFIATFQLGVWPFVYWGMTTTIVTMPLSFLAMFLFIRYLYNERYYLFPLLLVSTLLAYTHLVNFAITWMFFIIFFVYKLVKERKTYADIKKICFFGALNFLTCLPICYNLLSYTSFIRTNWLSVEQKTISEHISLIFTTLKRRISFINPSFLSMVFLALLLFFRGNTLDLKGKRILRNTLVFNLFIFFIILLKDVPSISIFIERIEWMYLLYIVVLNFSLFLLFKMNRRVKALGVAVILLIILNVQPLANYWVPSVREVSVIDNKLNNFISKRDYVLFENLSHLQDKLEGLKDDENEIDELMRRYSHWVTYFQEKTGAKFFSHQGEDVHPFNKLRHMYITNGSFKDKLLGEENEEEFTELLKDWGVNKVCVWSPTARRFFESSPFFRLLGNSVRYRCYRATYDIVPEVRLSKAGEGKIIDETPFSFTVHLKNISEKQNVIINKNYFDFWSAYDEKGNKIALREHGQRISFDIANNGYIFFKFRKNLLLSLVSLLALLAALIIDIFHRKRTFTHLNISPKAK